MHQEFLTRNTKLKLKKKSNKKKKQVFLFIISLIIIIFSSFAIVSYTKNKIGGWLVQLAELEEGELLRTVPLTGFIMKEETLLYAPAAGQLTTLVSEGQRIAVGGTIGKIQGGYDSQFQNRIDHLIIAPAAGIVSYEIDGLENLLNLNNEDGFDLTKLPKEEKTEILLLDRIVKGQPIGKIINNLIPMGLLIPFDSREVLELVQQEGTVSFKLGDGSLDFVHAKLIETRGEANGLMIFEMLNFQEEIVNLRRLDLELVLEHYQGLVINEEALVYEHEVPGLMLIDKNNTYKWHPIKINGQIDEQLVISGLNKGISYIINPR